MNKRKTILGLMLLCSATLPKVNYAQIAQTVNKSKKETIMTIEKNKASDEAQIRGQIDNFVKAFRTRDLNLMMSLYAPEFVAFDIVPPLQQVGTDTYRNVWEQVFAFFQHPIDFETRDLSIVTGADVAFSHQLLRMQTTMPNGQKVDRWERLTFGFRKIDGVWLIAHEHVSVPADLFSGRAVLDLQP
ncbi:MAG: nuclear transport factor 2 family protein [Chitinophaga sp.]|uniref:YybH family protein n=1 Tax=Chitinophaga sp. TaxID=1869181 RepID=UPI001B0BDEB2|nr:nuclear transport factor 2 family protein [Chitinophaga sp.]MBO9729386.1 nuclear transport factor 2 family protein [Chitinophaga sp.]